MKLDVDAALDREVLRARDAPPLDAESAVPCVLPVWSDMIRGDARAFGGEAQIIKSGEPPGRLFPANSPARPA